MNTQLTRPGTLPAILLHSSPWNADAVRKVSFEDASWRAILVSDETGPVGAVCYEEPSIYPVITVDAVVMHPERASSLEQIRAVIETALPVLRTVAHRFKATRIVFDSTSPILRSVLSGYGAREESVTLSIGLDVAVEPMVIVTQESEAVTTPADPLFACKCGKSWNRQAYLTNHRKKCKEA